MAKRTATNNSAKPTLTASQKVELYIKEAMYHGLLKPRERLVEQELAQKLGCSRAPVREAVFRLVREGLIVTVPRRGVFIRDLSQEAIEEIFQMRAKLESLTVKYMRMEMKPQTRQALDDCLEHLAEASAAQDDEKFIEWEMRLHRTIWKSSGRTEIYRVLNAMMIPYILLAARATGSKVPLAASLEHHRFYVNTILSTPVDEVEREVERYFTSIYDQLFRKSPQPLERRQPPATWLLDGTD